MDHAKLVSVMRRLAIEAGDKIMEIYGADDFDVRAKSDDSPVTAADEAADALISAGLRKVGVLNLPRSSSFLVKSSRPLSLSMPTPRLWNFSSVKF